MKSSISLAFISLLLISYVDAGCMCSCHGDPHVTQCDQAPVDIQAEGQFQIFKTDTLEVQCQFSKQTPSDQVTFVDSCQVNIKGNGCEVCFKDGGVKKTGQYQMYGENIDKTKVQGEFDNLPKDMKVKFNLVNDNEYIVTVDTGAQGVIEVHKTNQAIAINAPSANQCSGLCGSCSGNKTPTNPMEFGKQHCTDGGIAAAGNGKRCGAGQSASPASSAPGTTNPPTTKPSSPAPTTKAATTAPSSKPSTPAPTTQKPSSGTTPKPSTAASVSPATPSFKPCDESKIAQHPTFENEGVMKEVLKQCAAGRDPKEMETDRLFATYVENCVYDKSMGAGAEPTAVSTMETYMRMAAFMNSNAPKNSSNTGNSTSTPAPVKLNTAMIMKRSVSKAGPEIAMGAGVTYQLQFTVKPLPSVPLDEKLLPRDRVFSGAGSPSEISEDEIKAMKKGASKEQKKKHHKKHNKGPYC